MRRILKHFKRIAALLSAVTLAAAAVPAAAAEAELPEKWDKPSNITIRDKSNTTVKYLYNFTLNISFDKGDDLSRFLSMDEGERISAYGKNAEKINAKAQIDWSIDNTESWVYDKYRSEWDTLSSKNSEVWDYSGSSERSEQLTGAKTEERDILNLYSDVKSEWLTTGLNELMTPYVYKLQDAYFNNVSLIDLKLHTIYIRIRFVTKLSDGSFIYSDWSDTAAIGKEAKPSDNPGIDNPDKNNEPKIDVTWSGVSDWAADSVKTAAELGLYPKVLDKENLTRSINRREFAGVVVSLLNGLGLETTLPAENPFSDTRDINVLMAYNAGVMLGKSADMFIPMEAITREETAVILDRVYKTAYDRGLMKELSAVKEVKFSDDGDISVWAKDAVYEMASAGIIEGVGEGNFAPKNITAEQKREGYADTSIEQALALSLRLYRLKK